MFRFTLVDDRFPGESLLQYRLRRACIAAGRLAFGLLKLGTIAVVAGFAVALLYAAFARTTAAHPDTTATVTDVSATKEPKVMPMVEAQVIAALIKRHRAARELRREYTGPTPQYCIESDVREASPSTTYTEIVDALDALWKLGLTAKTERYGRTPEWALAN